MDNNRDYYNEYISNIKKLDHEEALYYLKRSILRLDLVSPSKLSDSTIDIIGIVTITFLILITGSLSIDPLFYFGFVFFIVGLMVGLFVRGFGIIFLFSHGLTGLSFMLSNIIKPVLDSPIMNEAPTKIYMYLNTGILFLIIPTILVVIASFSERLRTLKHFKIYIMIMYYIGIAIIRLFPSIINVLVR